MIQITLGLDKASKNPFTQKAHTTEENSCSTPEKEYLDPKVIANSNFTLDPCLPRVSSRSDFENSIQRVGQGNSYSTLS